MENKNVLKLTSRKFNKLFKNSLIGLFSLEELVDIAMIDLPEHKVNAPTVQFEGCYYTISDNKNPELIIKRELINNKAVRSLEDVVYADLKLFQVGDDIISCDKDFESLIRKSIAEKQKMASIL